MSAKRIGEILIEKGLLDQSQLTRALQLQEAETPPRKLGEILVAEGFIPERQFFWTLSQHLGVEFMDLHGNSSLGSAVNEVPAAMARELKVFPTIASSSGSLFVATADPLNVDAKNQLRHHTGKKINLFLDWMIATR